MTSLRSYFRKLSSEYFARDEEPTDLFIYFTVANASVDKLGVSGLFPAFRVVVNSTNGQQVPGTEEERAGDES